MISLRGGTSPLLTELSTIITQAAHVIINFVIKSGNTAQQIVGMLYLNSNPNNQTPLANILSP